MPTSSRMTPRELSTAVALAAAFFLRTLGLFMVLPVLALYVNRLPGATPLLIGLAIGLYGCTQALLQIPFGHWSDRYGRKPVIALGLTVFAIGGLVAASAQHIATVILGRALQGAGAVSGATLALAADLTRPEQRIKTMAIIGISIGAAFPLAFMIGPIIDAYFGLRGVFLAGAAGGIGALALVVFAVPRVVAPPAPIAAADPGSNEVRSLYLGVLFLHLILAASFVAIPMVLLDELRLEKSLHPTVYVPALLVSVLCVAPLIRRSHRGGISTGLFPVAITCIAIAQFALWLGAPTKGLVIAFLSLFFVGFNFLEALLPSMISRAAPSNGTGAALGAYSTGQFVGTFCGGLLGGAAATWCGTRGVFGVLGAVSILWLGLTLFADQAKGLFASRWR